MLITFLLGLGRGGGIEGSTNRRAGMMEEALAMKETLAVTASPPILGSTAKE